MSEIAFNVVDFSKLRISIIFRKAKVIRIL